MIRTLRQITEHFRGIERDNKITLAAVTHKMELRLALAAWSVLHVDFDAELTIDDEGLSAAELWTELWSDGVDYDTADLAVAMGTNEDAATAAIEQAKALRLIYPDGTVSGPAKIICEVQIMDSAQKPVRKK